MKNPLTSTTSQDLFTWNSQYKILDHWRAIAALWVMFYHGFGVLYDTPLHPVVEPIKELAKPGWLGVHLFFVISGYCIAASVYRSCAKGETSPSQFLLSRAKRLLPVYWLAFLFSLCVNLFASPFNSTDFWSNFPDSWQSWIGNIFLIQPYLNVPYFVVVYWSLVVEVGFYLIVTGLLLISQQFNYKTAIITGLSLGAISLFVPSSFSVQVVSFWAEFLCGVLVFSALFSQQHSQGKKLKNISLFILVLFFLSGGLTQFSLIESQLWFSALFSLLLYVIYPWDDQLNSIVAIRWLRPIGVMSYSLYLLHVPVQGKVVNLGTRIFPPDGLEMLLVQVLGWAVSLAASYLFFRTVEKPLNDWRRIRKTMRQSTHENPSHC